MVSTPLMDSNLYKYKCEKTVLYMWAYVCYTIESILLVNYRLFMSMYDAAVNDLAHTISQTILSIHSFSIQLALRIPYIVCNFVIFTDAIFFTLCFLDSYYWILQITTEINTRLFCSEKNFFIFSFSIWINQYLQWKHWAILRFRICFCCNY